MAKNKSFDFDSLMPGAAKLPEPKTTTQTPEKTAEIKRTPPPSARPTAAAMTAAAPQEFTETTRGQKGSNQLSMQPKKKNDKRVNYIVNEDEHNEFTKINKRLGYKNNEVYINLMRKYIEANREG